MLGNLGDKNTITKFVQSQVRENEYIISIHTSLDSSYITKRTSEIFIKYGNNANVVD